MSRSVNAEITLDPGRYHVLMKITAYRQRDVESTEEVVSRLASTRREKLVQIGLSYDLAHAKGLIVETENEKKEREDGEERRKVAERQKLRKKTKERLQKEWIRERKLEGRQQRAQARRQGAESKQNFEANGYTKQTNGITDRVSNGVFTRFPTEMDSLGIASTTNGSTNGSVPTIQFNGEDAAKYQSGRAASPRPNLDAGLLTNGFDPSDADLLDGFEFDSDLDMPPEEPAPVKATPAPTSGGYSDEVNSDPWNAVCVVGLRVYSKDPKLSLEVVRPVRDDDMEAALDRDDPAASATNEKSFLRRICF